MAREYGLPAVANAEGATDLLRDGDVVRVDGSRGVVEVVSRAGGFLPGPCCLPFRPELQEKGWTPVHKLLLEYLVKDESKHDTLLQQLDALK